MIDHLNPGMTFEYKKCQAHVAWKFLRTGEFKAADVVQLSSLTTVQGQDITIIVNNGSVMVDNANVTTTDIICSNGVIHVIDAVILPQ